MGSYAQCWLGGLYVGSSKNDVDHGIMQLFRPSDKRTLPARSVGLPSQLNDWTDDLEDDDANVVFYATPAAVVQARLELLGYTLDTAKSAFAKSLSVDVANMWSGHSKGQAQDRFWTRLKACQTDPDLVATTDWRGVRAILGELFTAFRNLDRDQILGGLDDYYGDRD